MRLAAATCVLMTAVSAANGQAPLPPPSSDPLAARAKGRPDAPVTVYEMSDFQCPYCRSFALTTMPLLEKEYVQTGKVRFVYVNLPLTTRHPNATAAAELAMCAARQGKFWPLHNLLFQHQDAWASRKDPAPYLLALGDSAGLDHARLARCVSAKATAAEVREDATRAGAAPRRPLRQEDRPRGGRASRRARAAGGVGAVAARPQTAARVGARALRGRRSAGQAGARDAPGRTAAVAARLYLLFPVRRAARPHAPRGLRRLSAVRPRGRCGGRAGRATTFGAGVLEARRMARAHARRAAARDKAGADLGDSGARQLAAALAGAPLGGARLSRPRSRGDNQ